VDYILNFVNSELDYGSAIQILAPAFVSSYTAAEMTLHYVQLPTGEVTLNNGGKMPPTT